MKNLKPAIYFILFCISFGQTVAQDDYIPIIKENSYWFIENQPGAAYLEPTSNVNIEYFSFGFRGDTIIENKAYKKLWYKKYNDFIEKFFDNGFSKTGVMSYMREDIEEKKVYAIYTGEGYPGNCDIGKEILIFDFNVEIGDTVQTSCIYKNSPIRIISTINNYESFGFNFRVYTLKPMIDNGDDIDAYMIEGMGGRSGPIGPLHTSIMVATGGTLLYHLCFDEEQNCLDQIVSEHEVLGINSLGVWPNPTNDKINIDLQTIDFNHHTKVSIFIKNINGRTLLSKSLENINHSESIDVNELAKGIYIIEIFEHKKRRKHVSRFIKI